MISCTPNQCVSQYLCSITPSKSRYELAMLPCRLLLETRSVIMSGGKVDNYMIVWGDSGARDSG